MFYFLILLEGIKTGKEKMKKLSRDQAEKNKRLTAEDKCKPDVMERVFSHSLQLLERVPVPTTLEPDQEYLNNGEKMRLRTREISWTAEEFDMDLGRWVPIAYGKTPLRATGRIGQFHPARPSATQAVVPSVGALEDDIEPPPPVAKRVRPNAAPE